MATIKAYTDLEQSKKLAEILPLESADMFYNEEPDETYPKDIVDTKYPMIIREGQKHYLEEYGIPCWSLAALLSAIPNYKLSSEHNYHSCAAETPFGKETVDWFDNPVDACYEMILKLYELKML